MTHIRILSDSTNTKSSSSPIGIGANKATPSSIVLSLTHAHSHSSPTSSSSGIAFPAIEELDSVVQKPNAKPGKRHYTCLSLLKTQNQVPDPSGMDAQGVKKRQRTTSSSTSSQRSGTRKRLVLGLLGSKQRLGSNAARGAAKGSSIAPPPKSTPSPRRTLTDLIFIEALCKSVIHHWTHAPVEATDKLETVHRGFAIDKELVWRLNEVLVRHGRRGVVLAIAALSDRGNGNGAVDGDEMDLDGDGDDAMTVDEAVPSHSPPMSSASASTSMGIPTVALSERVAFATLPAGCHTPVSPPPSPPRSRMRSASILTPPHRPRLAPPNRPALLRSAPSSPAKTAGNVSVPKSITHIVAIAILRQRNKTRTKKRRVLSSHSSLVGGSERSSRDASASDGDGDDEDEDEEAASLKEGGGKPVASGKGKGWGSPLVREVM